MSKRCAITGKGPLTGNKRSHAMNATRRKWNVNLQKVTINGTDGKTYGLNASTTSTLYNKSGQKIGVTDLAVGDTVYAVYKNFLLNYLEVQTVKASEPVITDKTVYGTIRAIISEKDTIIVLDEKEELHTIIVDKNTKITYFSHF